MKFKRIFLINLLLFSFNCEAMMSLETFIDDMVMRHGFDKMYLTQLFEKTEIQKSVIRLMSRKPTGKASPWYRYRRKFISESRIKSGAKFWRKHARTLRRAEAQYGVPAEIIVAIIGVETIYGKHTGNYSVLNALMTLAFHVERRADFFRKELEHFLLLTRENGINPLILKGSYAGAMGLGQFMPSSYRNYAIDFNGDGRKDIWNNVDDAIGSVANYFKHHGWQTGEKVITATQARKDSVDSLADLGMKPKYNLKSLKKMGLVFYGAESDRHLGSFINLETEQGMAYWVAFQNFYVITRYNHSTRYAMAVYQLSQEVASEYEQI